MRILQEPPVRPDSHPERLQGWLRVLGVLRKQYRHDPKTLQAIERAEAVARGWLEGSTA